MNADNMPPLPDDVPIVDAESYYAYARTYANQQTAKLRAERDKLLQENFTLRLHIGSEALKKADLL